MSRKRTQDESTGPKFLIPFIEVVGRGLGMGLRKAYR
jgi:hypothetical protein